MPSKHKKSALLFGAMSAGTFAVRFDNLPPEGGYTESVFAPWFATCSRSFAETVGVTGSFAPVPAATVVNTVFAVVIA